MARSSTCLLVASIFAPIHGGSANVYASLCRLSPQGSMVVLAARGYCGRAEKITGWAEHDQHCGYPVHRLDLLRPPILPAPANKFVSAWRFLTMDLPSRAKVLGTALQLIHRHNIGLLCVGELNSTGWLAGWCRRLTGCRVMYYIHGEEITTRFDSGSYGQKRSQYLSRADAIIAVSRFTRRALVEDMGLPAERVHLIENAVDTGKFSPGADDGAFRQRWGVTGKRLVVGVGRLVPRKGFDHALRGWQAVVARHPAAHLMIVGDGPQRPELQQLVESAGLQNHATLTGPLSDADLVAAYRSADLFIMPNRTMPDGDTEGFGLVFLEANACGRAVVGGRAGGAVEAVRNGETGLLVDGNSVEEISAAINSLLSDDELRKRLEQGALAHAQANSWTTRAAEFQTLCRQLAAS
ncbi:glycosyltransferase family 4 protein [Propionivibrio sp.]|uniref:glycosyltransferase family 4 protein n=1 Tax=Propionivibrio sp. TaxID=2212460 RepID=UPI003BEF7A7E